MLKYHVKYRWLDLALLIAMAPAYYLVPWHSLPGPAGGLGILFLICYLFLLPGNLLRRAFASPTRDPLDTVALSFLYGIFYFLLVSFFWALFDAHLQSLQVFLPLLIFVTLCFLLVPAAKTRRGEDLWRGHSISMIIMVAVCALVFFFVGRSGVPVGYTKDTLDHIGYVGEIQKTGETFPTSVVYLNAGQDGEDIRKGLIHVLYGYSSRYLRMEPLACLNAWNAFFAVLIILSIYAVSLRLFKNKWIAVISAVLFLIGDSGSMLRQSTYANSVAAPFFFFYIAFVLRFLERGNRRDLINCAFFAFAASSVHIFYAVLSGLVVLVAAAWKVCFPNDSVKMHLSRLFSSGAAAAAGVVPYGLFRYFTAYREPNELHKGIQGVVYVTRNLFISDPLKFGVLGWIAVLLAFALWKQRSKHVGLGYLIAACFTVASVLFNPIFFVPLYFVFSYLVFRLPELCPFFMLGGYYFVCFLNAKRTGRRRTIQGWLLFISILLVIVFESGPLLRGDTFSQSSLEKERRNSYLLWADGLDFIKNDLPKGSVIVSDPVTSYSIAAFSSDYVVCTLDQHAPPGDSHLEKRMRAARDILSPVVSMSTTTSLLKAEKAEYIVLNNRISGHLLLNYWSIDPEAFDQVSRKFASRPDLFEPVFGKRDLMIFRWNGRMTDDSTSFAGSYLLSQIPNAFTRFGREAGKANLEAFRLEQRTVERGGSIEIDFIWSGRGSYRFGNYRVMVRFNHQDPKLPFDGKPFPKVSRKAKEALIKARYRFISGHMILDGFLSPDVWPEGSLVLDETTVHIPRDIVPGVYNVSVKLGTLAYKPSYWLRDLFYDDDLYQGVPICTLEIR